MPNSNFSYYVFADIEGVEYIRGPQGQIPMDDGNPDYRAYLAWVAEGNSPSPYPQQ